MTIQIKTEIKRKGFLKLFLKNRIINTYIILTDNSYIQGVKILDSNIKLIDQTSFNIIK